MAETSGGPYQGSVLGTLAKGQQSIVYSGSIQDQWTGNVLTPNAGTFWSLGSCTKSFTATLFGMQVTKGMVPVSPNQLVYPLVQQYLPSGTVPTALEQITLEQLASMTSGLPDIPTLQPVSQVSTLFEALMKSSTYGQPGKFLYSDLSFALLSFAMAVCAGSQPSSEDQLPAAVLDLLKSYIFNPLSMGSATFYPPQAGSVPSQGPAYNFPYGNGPKGTQENGSKANWPAYAGAGALYMTAGDLMTWLTANMAGEAGPLGAAATFVQSDPQPTNGYAEGQWITRGWFTDSFPTPSGQTLVMVDKNGDIPGFHCGIAFLQPESPGGASEYGVFVAYNYEQPTVSELQTQLIELTNS